MFNFRPKKFKKFHKVKLTHKNNVIFRQKPSYGQYLIKSIDAFDFTVSQIMVCRSLITKLIKAENKSLVTKGSNICYSRGIAYTYGFITIEWENFYSRTFEKSNYEGCNYKSRYCHCCVYNKPYNDIFKSISVCCCDFTCFYSQKCRN